MNIDDLLQDRMRRVERSCSDFGGTKTRCLGMHVKVQMLQGTGFHPLRSVLDVAM